MYDFFEIDKETRKNAIIMFVIRARKNIADINILVIIADWAFEREENYF